MTEFQHFRRSDVMTADNTSELQALLDLATAGDGDATREILNRTALRLLALTRRMLAGYPQLKRWEQTDDVFQNATLRLYRSLADVRPENPRAYYGLAATQIRRTLIDLLRHHFGPHGSAAQHQTDPKVVEGSSAPGIVANQPATETNVVSLVQWAEFHGAVDALPEDERSVFELIWYGGCTQKEAAGLLRISERTVIRWLNRARLQIQQSMDGERPDNM